MFFLKTVVCPTLFIFLIYHPSQNFQMYFLSLLLCYYYCRLRHVQYDRTSHGRYDGHSVVIVSCQSVPQIRSPHEAHLQRGIRHPGLWSVESSNYWIQIGEPISVLRQSLAEQVYNILESLLVVMIISDDFIFDWVSYVRNGILYIKPTLTSDRYGEGFLYNGKLDLWSDGCNYNYKNGCQM